MSGQILEIIQFKHKHAFIITSSSELHSKTERWLRWNIVFGNDPSSAAVVWPAVTHMDVFRQTQTERRWRWRWTVWCFAQQLTFQAEVQQHVLVHSVRLGLHLRSLERGVDLPGAAVLRVFQFPQAAAHGLRGGESRSLLARWEHREEPLCLPPTHRQTDSRASLTLTGPLHPSLARPVNPSECSRIKTGKPAAWGEHGGGSVHEAAVPSRCHADVAGRWSARGEEERALPGKTFPHSQASEDYTTSCRDFTIKDLTCSTPFPKRSLVPS